jgi:hypothetical protein
MSAIALVLSMLSIVLSAWMSWRQNRLQERLVELETSREHDRLKAARSTTVVASIEHERRPDTRFTESFLQVSNTGATGARDIQVTIDDTPLVQHAHVFVEDPAVTQLGAHASARYPVAVPFGSASVVVVRVTWTNESDEPGEWKSQLRL